MKKIILNGKLMENNPHEYMKKSLNFPEYYGKNLDALFDCLSEIGEKTEITLIYSKKIKKTIITTFKDAEKENQYLSIKIE